MSSTHPKLFIYIIEKKVRLHFLVKINQGTLSEHKSIFVSLCVILAKSGQRLQQWDAIEQWLADHYF